MRILLLNWKCPDHPAAGGAEVYTHQVAKRWVAWGHRVTWFAAAVPGAPAQEVRDGITLLRRGSRLGVYAAARRYLRGLPDGAVDVIVDEVNTRPFLAPRHARDIPVVALIHQVAREIWFHEFPAPAAALGRYVLEPRWLRAYAATPVLTVSPSSAASLRAYGLRDVRIVGEGIDHEPVAAEVRKAATPTLCSVGRLAPSKRPHDVIDAFELVRRQIGAVALDVVGDGPLRSSIEARQVPGVRVHGHVPADRRAELVGRAHALLVTSVREGWGLVVDEAARRGTTTIAYDRPGLRDSVPAANGVLTSPNPAALAAAVIRHLPALTADPPTRGWNGGATDWNTVAKEILRHVEPLVA